MKQITQFALRLQPTTNYSVFKVSLFLLFLLLVSLAMGTSHVGGYGTLTTSTNLPTYRRPTLNIHQKERPL